MPIKYGKFELHDKKRYPFIYRVPTKWNLYLPKLLQKYFFDEAVYAEEYQAMLDRGYDFSSWKNRNIYTTTWAMLYPDCKRFNKINLNQKLQKRFDIEKKEISKNCIGIHIRRTDHFVALQNSPIELFVDAIKEEIKRDSDVSFYLASDDLQVKRNLRFQFGKRIITNFYEAKRNSVQGMQDAVIQLYLLSTTKKVIGSFNSSFSYQAAVLGNIKFEVIKK